MDRIPAQALCHELGALQHHHRIDIDARNFE
jgi:hypothetical protein